MRPKIDLYMVKNILKILSEHGRLHFYEIARKASTNNKKANPNTVAKYLKFLVATGLARRIQYSILSVEYEITQKGLQIYHALQLIPEITNEAFKSTPRAEYLKKG